MCAAAKQKIILSCPKRRLSFSFVEQNSIKKDIDLLQGNKNSPYADIPANISIGFSIGFYFLKSYPIFQKFMKSLCLMKFLGTLLLSFFSKIHCGFRKSYSVQHCLLTMLEKLKSAVSNGFQCFLHDLIIAK